MRLMTRIRESIKNDSFSEFTKNFLKRFYSTENKNEKIPEWVINALKSVNITIL